MTEQKQNLSVFRQLSPDSLLLIQSLQAEYANIKSFTPVIEPKLILLDNETLPHMSRTAQKKVIQRAPISTVDSYEMKVDSAKFSNTGEMLGYLAIKLVLNKNNGKYRNEHLSLRRLALENSDQQVAVAGEPSVAIGHLLQEFALESNLLPAKALTGQTLSFEPALSSLGKINKERIVNYSRTPIQAVTSNPDKTNIISSNFLASLRIRHEKIEE